MEIICIVAVIAAIAYAVKKSKEVSLLKWELNNTKDKLTAANNDIKYLDKVLKEHKIKA